MAVYIKRPEVIHLMDYFFDGMGKRIYHLECGGEVPSLEGCLLIGENVYHNEWFSFSFYEDWTTCEDCLWSLRHG